MVLVRSPIIAQATGRFGGLFAGRACGRLQFRCPPCRADHPNEIQRHCRALFNALRAAYLSLSAQEQLDWQLFPAPGSSGWTNFLRFNYIQQVRRPGTDVLRSPSMLPTWYNDAAFTSHIITISPTYFFTFIGSLVCSPAAWAHDPRDRWYMYRSKYYETRGTLPRPSWIYVTLGRLNTNPAGQATITVPLGTITPGVNALFMKTRFLIRLHNGNAPRDIINENETQST